MSNGAASQAQRVEALIRAAVACRDAARDGRVFCRRAGLALVNAAYDLFECDGLYDLADDVRRQLHLDRDGWKLDDQGDRVV